MKRVKILLALLMAVVMIATGCKKLPEFTDGSGSGGGNTPTPTTGTLSYHLNGDPIIGPDYISISAKYGSENEITEMGLLVSEKADMPAGYTQYADIQMNYPEFSVTLTGLEPSTRYFWCINYLENDNSYVTEPVGFTTLESGGGSGGDIQTIPYTQNFSTSFGTYTTKDVVGEQSWIIDYSTATMGGYSNGTIYENEDWLISSPVLISGIEHTKVVVDYAARYNGFTDDITLQLSTNYQFGEDPSTASWSQLSDALINTASWSDFQLYEISIDEFIGQTITIAIKYKSTTERARTIEIRSISIEEGEASGGIGGGEAPTGAINGLFSVSDTKQVYFSKGNLQYQASMNKWRFAENQYDYVGEANSNISSYYDGWIDLFGWGTSGYNHGAVCYQPWSTSENNSDYYAYGNYSYNLSDQTGQADWGYNPISNGGNNFRLWRTLTSEEWVYLINTRNTSSGIRYAKAQVNGFNGIILLPDDWTSSTYPLNNTNTSNASYTTNVITATSWSVLEAAGAVFLTTAGSRGAGGPSVYNVGDNGNYWSATYFNSHDAYSMYYGNGYISTDGNVGRMSGRSVRLVHDAN